MRRFERPTHAHQVIAQKVSNTMVLLHLGSGEYYSLDEVGFRIWELCDGTRSIDDLIVQLCEEFDAPAGQVEQDVHTLLDELAAENLVIDRAALREDPLQSP